MGKNARFKQGKKKFANNNKRPNEPAQAQPKPQPQPQQPQAKKQKQQPAQQPQQPQENKKHFVCKNYDGKHGLGCKRGDKCPFTHLNGEELLLFQQFRSCSCLCNPTLDHSEPYIPVAPPKQQQKQQPPQQKNKNAKNKDNEEPVTLIDCLCVIETPKAALLDKIKELSTCDSQQHQQDKFWLRFPLTNVAFTISKISNSKEANFVKKIYTEGVAPNDDASTMIHIEELDENGSPINPVELWVVLGELKHQACILRFLERRLQTEFLFLPCRNENYIDEYKSALWAHPVKNIEEESLKNAPPLLARIDEAREQTGILGDDDDDDEAAFNQYMKDAGIFDDDDDGFYDEDDDEEMDEEALDDEDVIDDDGDEDYEDIEDEDEEMAKMFGKRGGPSARMMEEMMMAMMMQNMAGRGGKRGGFNPFMGMMDDDEDDDDM